VHTALLEQHSREAEPYQSGLATERGVLCSSEIERGGDGVAAALGEIGRWDRGYTAVRDCSFTVHNQFEGRRRQCEFLVLLKLT
jgi:hypothetical protein